MVTEVYLWTYMCTLMHSMDDVMLCVWQTADGD